ncbi:MAG: virulence RhuM family protein [Heliobacteriaceae bacterium]|jgi:hypothetical protein|nr:virulence RhuM family protein [Heliobacteriaceae bacterium]
MGKNELTNFNDNQGEFLIYTSPDGNSQIQVKLINESIWLNQKQIAALFGVDRSVITKHLQNIFESLELEELSVCAKIAHTAEDNKTYETQFYNLDAIISVGYRVNSSRATQFRQWATQRLREYIIKGFTINKEYLKSPEGKDYFDELLKIIREIRASEKRFYLKVRDIYATSVDYNAQSETTKEFFAMVQNKLLFAITGHTAAEIINERANANSPNAGLMTWEGNNIRVPDLYISKNYLNEEELENLELFVSQFLDFAELQAKNRKEMTMIDWAKKLDALLSVNDMNILIGKGRVKKEIAEKKARTEYDKWKEANKQRLEIEEEERFAIELEELQVITKQIQAKDEPLSDFNKKLVKAKKYEHNS